jgi:hypothetical protein
LNPLGYSAKVETLLSEIHIEPDTRKVGNHRKDFFDGMQINRFKDGIYEVSEYQAGKNEDELHIYKETKSLIVALKDLIKGNKRKPIKVYKEKGGVMEKGGVAKPKNSLVVKLSEKKLVPVNSLKEASKACMDYIDNWNLGSSNWRGGEVYDVDGKQVATVSYNGRVWEGKHSFSNQTKEITGEQLEKPYYMAKGGTTFKEKVEAISNRLKGTKVKPKYKKEYGSTYDAKEAKEAATKIAGAMVAKGKMEKGGTISSIRKLIENGEFDEAGKQIRLYGKIIKDVTVEKSNKRYTVAKFKGKYFTTKMKDGKTVGISESVKMPESLIF